MSIRKPVYAGSWYPASRSECESQIKSFLAESSFRTDIEGEIVGGVVPHAGWFFSGDIACSVIARVSQSKPAPDVVVVFGMHMPPDFSPHMMAEGEWETPLGNLETASDLAERIAGKHSFRIETPESFVQDNTIELQLPFIKYFFPDSRILAIGPPASETAGHIAESVVTEARDSGLRIKVIGSSDLTHYGPNFGFTPAGSGRKAYEWVRDKNDRQALDRMLEMNPAGVVEEGLARHNLCCPGAIVAAITAARALGAKKAGLMGYSSSYEKNPGSSFVGYGGIVYAA